MSQTERLYMLLKDGRPHRTPEILQYVYGDAHLGIARISARVWDVQKKYNVEIDGWHDKENPALYWYQLKQSITRPCICGCNQQADKLLIPFPVGPYKAADFQGLPTWALRGYVAGRECLPRLRMMPNPYVPAFTGGDK